LVAYLLDDLSPEQRATIEAHLARDPAWRRELERLEECLAATGDPATCCDEPPVDLVSRTCGLVERSERLLAPLAASQIASPVCLGGGMTAVDVPASYGRRRWSLADVTVCAGVLAALGMLVLPALRESRDSTRRVVCQQKLGALGRLLFDYHANNQQLPTVEPGEPAGIFAVKMADDLGVNRGEFGDVLRCPDSELAAWGNARQIPTRAQYEAASAAEREAMARTMGGSVAYALGYFDEQGNYRYVPFTGDGRRPMCGDSPRGARTSEHGRGVNVLFQDLNVRYCTERDERPECDEMYFNDRHEIAAGLSEEDNVLAPSGIRPEGTAGRLIYLQAD
jgi:prepilin-type processing-associated H-X9-DG protein